MRGSKGLKVRLVRHVILLSALKVEHLSIITTWHLFSPASRRPGTNDSGKHAGHHNQTFGGPDYVKSPESYIRIPFSA